MEAAHTVTLPGTLTLTATASDDGLPTPRAQGQRPRAVGQETPPLLKPAAGSVAAPKNLPGLRVNPRGRQVHPLSPEGLAVSYRVWRGPAGVTFEPAFAEVTDGTAATTATFQTPGTYVLRARATDGRIVFSSAGNPSGDAKSTELDLTVIVRGAPSASRP